MTLTSLIFNRVEKAGVKLVCKSSEEALSFFGRMSQRDESAVFWYKHARNSECSECKKILERLENLDTDSMDLGVFDKRAPIHVMYFASGQGEGQGAWHTGTDLQICEHLPVDVGHTGKRSFSAAVSSEVETTESDEETKRARTQADPPSPFVPSNLSEFGISPARSAGSSGALAKDTPAGIIAAKTPGHSPLFITEPASASSLDILASTVMGTFASPAAAPPISPAVPVRLSPELCSCLPGFDAPPIFNGDQEEERLEHTYVDGYYYINRFKDSEHTEKGVKMVATEEVLRDQIKNVCQDRQISAIRHLLTDETWSKRHIVISILKDATEKGNPWREAKCFQRAGIRRTANTAWNKYNRLNVTQTGLNLFNERRLSGEGKRDRLEVRVCPIWLGEFNRMSKQG
jgi:hypothetical protein